MQRDIGEEEKDRLMKEHEANMVKFEANLKKEQDRTKEMLRQKLEERRKKKKSMELDKIKAGYQDSVKSASAEEQKKLADLQTESAKVLTSATPGLAPKPIHERGAAEG